MLIDEGVAGVSSCSPSSARSDDEMQHITYTSTSVGVGVLRAKLDNSLEECDGVIVYASVLALRQ